MRGSSEICAPSPRAADEARTRDPQRYGNGLAIQSDGRIVAVGGSYAGAGGTHDFALARYTPDGSPDTSFDGDGKLTTDFGRPNPNLSSSESKRVLAARR